MLTEGLALREQVQAGRGGRVDRDDRLTAEGEDRLRDVGDGAGLVEGGDQLAPVGAAALVERDELLVAGLRADVHAAVAHAGTVASRP